MIICLMSTPFAFCLYRKRKHEYHQTYNIAPDPRPTNVINIRNSAEEKRLRKYSAPTNSYRHKLSMMGNETCTSTPISNRSRSPLPPNYYSARHKTSRFNDPALPTYATITHAPHSSTKKYSNVSTPNFFLDHTRNERKISQMSNNNPIFAGYHRHQASNLSNATSNLQQSTDQTISACSPNLLNQGSDTRKDSSLSVRPLINDKQSTSDVSVLTYEDKL